MSDSLPSLDDEDPAASPRSNSTPHDKAAEHRADRIYRPSNSLDMEITNPNSSVEYPAFDDSSELVSPKPSMIVNSSRDSDPVFDVSVAFAQRSEVLDREANSEDNTPLELGRNLGTRSSTKSSWNDTPDLIRDAVSSQNVNPSSLQSVSEDKLQTDEHLRQVIHKLNAEDYVPSVPDDPNVMETALNDVRHYRSLILSNNMRVLLVSDPNGLESVAALSVNAGYMMDPPSLQGMAHFLAHALFSSELDASGLGSKNLNENPDVFHMKTVADSTIFSFATTSTKFFQQLKTLEQCIANPMITTESVNRAIDCIQSELKARIFDDRERSHCLDKFLCKSSHPYSHSNYGLHRLRNTGADHTELIQDALKFYQAHYSANRMDLVIIGQQEMNELEEFVVSTFSSFRNRNVPFLSWKEYPYGPQQLCTKIEIVAVKNTRFLQLVFPMPDLSGVYKSGVTQYMSWMLTHEHPGGLMAHLRANHWATAISAYYERPAPEFGFFKIDITITAHGFTNLYSVVLSCFQVFVNLRSQYLELLRISGPQRWAWSQVKQLEDVKLMYGDGETGSSIEFAEDLVTSSKFYPFYHVVLGKHIVREYVPRHIQAFVNALLPSNLRMFVTAKENLNIVNETEELMGVKYKYTKLSKARLKKWSDPEVPEHFALPQPNLFVPQKLVVKDMQFDAGIPQLIDQTLTYDIWYTNRRTKDQKPTAAIVLALLSALPTQSARNMIGTLVIVNMLGNILRPTSYDAKAAGINHKFEAHISGLTITIHGYNDKLDKYLEAVVETLMQIPSIGIVAAHFSTAQTELVKVLKGWHTEEPFEQALQLVHQVLNKNSWNPANLLKSLHDEEFTASWFSTFAKQFVQQLKVVWLFVGNLTEEEADDIAINCMPKFGQLDPPNGAQISPFHFQPPTLASNVATVIKAEHKAHTQSACLILFQVGEGGPKDCVRAEMLCQMLQVAAKATENDKGHRIQAGTKLMAGFSSIFVSVQDELAPVILESWLEEFLINFRSFLRVTYSHHPEFAKFIRNFKRNKMYDLKAVKDDSIARAFLDEIVAGTHGFNKHVDEITTIDEIEYGQLFDMYNTHICPRSDHRRKLTVLVANANKRNEVVNLQNRSAQALDHQLMNMEVQVHQTAASGSDFPNQNIRWADELSTGRLLERDNKIFSDTIRRVSNVAVDAKPQDVINVAASTSGVRQTSSKIRTNSVPRTASAFKNVPKTGVSASSSLWKNSFSSRNEKNKKSTPSSSSLRSKEQTLAVTPTAIKKTDYRKPWDNGTQLQQSAVSIKGQNGIRTGGKSADANRRRLVDGSKQLNKKDSQGPKSFAPLSKTATINAEKSQTVLFKALNQSQSGARDVCDFDYDFETEIKRLQTLKRWLQVNGQGHVNKATSGNVAAAVPANYNAKNEIARLFHVREMLNNAEKRISQCKNKPETVDVNCQINAAEVQPSSSRQEKCLTAGKRAESRLKHPDTCTVYDVEKEITRLNQIKKFFDGTTRELSQTEYTVFTLHEIQYDCFNSK